MWIKRSYEAELLDGSDFSRSELFRNLRELQLVNRFLGGHENSISIMKICLRSGYMPKAIVDIGCGGGDTLEILQQKFRGQVPDAQWIGCDLNPDCVEYARQTHPGKGIRYLKADFREIDFSDSGRVLFHASLFFHHFREDDILHFLRFVRKSGSAMIINDLQRNPLAWAGIKLISSLPGVGRLFRNDAPLSVKRGFMKSEWTSLLREAGFSGFRIERAWAFRHLIFIPAQIDDKAA
jgi:SAM-dependent methyltransferase